MKLVLMQAHHIPLTINILKYTKLDKQIGRSVSMYAENFFPSLLTLRRMNTEQPFTPISDSEQTSRGRSREVPIKGGAG